MLELSNTNLQRINIIGVSGRGKSTLAKALSTLLDSKYIQLDGLYHEANWVEVDIGVFRDRLQSELNNMSCGAQVIKKPFVVLFSAVNPLYFGR